jgi:hypothetical protein
MGRDLTVSRLIVGDSAISTFKDNGLEINRQAIEVVEPLIIVNLQANTPKLFDFSKVGFYFIPKSIWGYKGSQINNNESFLIDVKDTKSNQSIWKVQLQGKMNTLGETFCFEFPYCCISLDHSVYVTSSVNLISVSFFGIKAYLNDPITPII